MFGKFGEYIVAFFESIGIYAQKKDIYEATLLQQSAIRRDFREDVSGGLKSSQRGTPVEPNFMGILEGRLNRLK